MRREGQLSLLSPPESERNIFFGEGGAGNGWRRDGQSSYIFFLHWRFFFFVFIFFSGVRLHQNLSRVKIEFSVPLRCFFVVALDVCVPQKKINLFRVLLSIFAFVPNKQKKKKKKKKKNKTKSAPAESPWFSRRCRRLIHGTTCFAVSFFPAHADAFDRLPQEPEFAESSPPVMRIEDIKDARKARVVERLQNKLVRRDEERRRIGFLKKKKKNNSFLFLFSFCLFFFYIFVLRVVSVWLCFIIILPISVLCSSKKILFFLFFF